MGAARSTGAMGMTIAGESSGERSVAVGAIIEYRLGSTGESDVAGEHIGGTGMPENDQRRVELLIQKTPRVWVT
jgi:hypothetical protein